MYQKVFIAYRMGGNPLRSKGPSWAIILGELKKRRAAIVAVVGSMILASGMTLIQPLFFKILFDEAIPQKDGAMVGWLVLGMVGIPLTAMGVSYFQEWLRAYIGEHVSQALRTAAFGHAIHFKFVDIENLTSAEIASRIKLEAGKVGEMYIAQDLLPVISSVVMFFGTLGFMFYLNVKLALIAAVAIPITSLLTRYMSKRSQLLDRELSNLLERGSVFLQETLLGLRTIRAFNGEDHARSRWAEWIQEHIRIKNKSSAFHHFMLHFPSELINTLIVGILFGYGAYEIMNDRMTVGSLVAFVAYAPRIYNALRVVFRTYEGTLRVQISIEKLDAIFTHPTELEAGKPDRNLPTAFHPPRIEFQNVSFHYTRGAGVRNLSFGVQPGEFLGIVGPTGGGKTTLIDLLLRFYDIDEGSISIDGVNTDQIALETLRRNIALIPQQVFLWNTTILENIIYPHKQMDLNRVENVVRMAQLDTFVANLPEKYETIVGEDGMTLSGGERQRIAIARALLKQPRILLMDEATSALDAITEAKVRDAIAEARKDKTTLVIAHRLSTVWDADRIMVIDEKGTIAEMGTPKELLENGGYFAELYRAQALEEAAAH